MEPEEADFGIFTYYSAPDRAGTFRYLNMISNSLYTLFTCRDGYSGSVTITVEHDNPALEKSATGNCP